MIRQGNIKFMCVYTNRFNKQKKNSFETIEHGKFIKQIKKIFNSLNKPKLDYTYTFD